MSALWPVEAAHAAVLQRAVALEPTTVGVRDAAGQVLAEPIRARFDLPQRDVSIMDGYAVRAGDVRADDPSGRFAQLRCTTESAAGHPSSAALAPGEAARISTGAVIVQGADAVIAQEETLRDGDCIRIDLEATGVVQPGRFVRPRGSDVGTGQIVLEPGVVLRPPDLAAAAASGNAELRVHRRPRVAIVSTGDELVAVGTVPGAGQVVSSNGLMLAALVRDAGAVPIDLGDVGDDAARTQACLRKALRADVVVTSGGISVGDHDLVFDALQRLGLAVVFRGVALRPGKPTTFAVDDSTLAFALPGNPASTLVAFELFVRPALRRMLGVRGDVHRPVIEVRLLAPVRGAGSRDHYVRARAVAGDTAIGAQPLPSQKSGNLRSIADHDLLLRIRAGTERLDAGACCEALLTHPDWRERGA
jgi:molybdopterin molybdotransferase